MIFFDIISTPPTPRFDELRVREALWDDYMQKKFVKMVPQFVSVQHIDSDSLMPPISSHSRMHSS